MKNWKAMFAPLSANPRIPVGLELTITNNLEILYDKHFYLLIPRVHFTTNPNVLLAMTPADDSHFLHSPFNTLDIEPTQILTAPLNPATILGNFNAELEYTTHGNRSQDACTLQLLNLFNNTNPGPLRNAFPHIATLPHCFQVIATGDIPDDD